MARACPPDRISRMLLHTRVQIVSKNLSVEAQDVFSVKLFYVGFYDLKREILSFSNADALQFHLRVKRPI